jgi:large subunit ribosomal protein L21
MFAVFKSGGKQYRVAPNETLKVARLDSEPGSIVQLGNVLMVGGDSPVLGNPVAGAEVAAEVIAHERGAKIISFKKRRRKNSRRKRGYRDEYTLIRITEILTEGKKPTVEARQKPAPKAKAEPTEGETEQKPVKKAVAKKPAAKAKAPAKTAAKKPAAKPKAKK